MFVFKVDVDTCDDIAEEYKITAMPTFILLKASAKVYELNVNISWKWPRELVEIRLRKSERKKGETRVKERKIKKE